MSEYVWVVAGQYIPTEVFEEEIDALRHVNGAQEDALAVQVKVQAKKGVDF